MSENCKFDLGIIGAGPAGYTAAFQASSYFLYFTVQPSQIDVNIHPTKTEIKFQNESDLFQILLAIYLFKNQIFTLHDHCDPFFDHFRIQI